MKQKRPLATRKAEDVQPDIDEATIVRLKHEIERITHAPDFPLKAKTIENLREQIKVLQTKDKPAPVATPVNQEKASPVLPALAPGVNYEANVAPYSSTTPTVPVNVMQPGSNIFSSDDASLTIESAIRSKLADLESMTPEERRKSWDETRQRWEEEEKARQAQEAERSNRRALEIQMARDRLKNRVPGDLNIKDTKAAIETRLGTVAALLPAYTAEQLAEHHKVSVKDIIKRLDAGQKVEMEHTEDAQESRQIASHHVHEHLEYYENLNKMEAKLEKSAELNDNNWERFYTIHISFRKIAPKLIDFCMQALRNMGYQFDVWERDRNVLIGSVEPKANKENFLSEELKKAAIDAEVGKIQHAIGKWAEVTRYEYDRPKK